MTIHCDLDDVQVAIGSAAEKLMRRRTNLCQYHDDVSQWERRFVDWERRFDRFYSMLKSGKDILYRLIHSRKQAYVAMPFSVHVSCLNGRHFLPPNWHKPGATKNKGRRKEEGTEMRSNIRARGCGCWPFFPQLQGNSIRHRTTSHPSRGGRERE